MEQASLSVIVNFIEQLTARKKKRLGWNGQLYTVSEFIEFYEEQGTHFFEKSCHFECLGDFMEHWQVKALASVNAPRCHCVLVKEALCGQFGILLLGYLLFIDIHHLKGKLHGSRLAPQVLRPDIWDSAIVIGCGSKRACHEQCSQTTHVIDYWTVILESDDPLMMMGNHELERHIDDLFQFLDGEQTTVLITKLAHNPIVQFLCVDLSS